MKWKQIDQAIGRILNEQTVADTDIENKQIQNKQMSDDQSPERSPKHPSHQTSR